MADNGPISGNGELYIGSSGVANVWLEVHTVNQVTTAITSGVPGGLLGTTSSQNNTPPGVFQGPPPATSYGQSYTTSSAAAYYAGGTSATGVANPNGAGNLLLFSMKLPGIFEFFAPEF